MRCPGSDSSQVENVKEVANPGQSRETVASSAQNDVSTLIGRDPVTAGDLERPGDVGEFASQDVQRRSGSGGRAGSGAPDGTELQRHSRECEGNKE